MRFAIAAALALVAAHAGADATTTDDPLNTGIEEWRQQQPGGYVNRYSHPMTPEERRAIIERARGPQHPIAGQQPGHAPRQEGDASPGAGGTQQPTVSPVTASSQQALDEIRRRHETRQKVAKQDAADKKADSDYAKQKRDRILQNENRRRARQGEAQLPVYR